MQDLIDIDGNFLEGGGQIVRTALALSTLLQKPFHITDIRKGRRQPGLKAQHLSAIKALKELCNAEVQGAKLGSTELTFRPGPIQPRTLSIDIGTAGSITLLLQSMWLPTILPPEAGKKFRLKIKGGTDTKWSMPLDYMQEVFFPQVQRYADIQLNPIRKGFYPKGGGNIDLKIKGRFTLDTISDTENPAPQINLDSQGHLIQIKGISHASTLLEKAQVAERQAAAAKKLLLKYNVPLQIEARYSETDSPGSVIVLYAIFSKAEDDIDVFNPIRLGADALGEQGKRAEIVGEEAAKKLIKEIESGAAVDEHMADNLIPLLAFFGGTIKTSNITPHTKTNIYTVEKFLGNCYDVDDKNRLIRKI